LYGSNNIFPSQQPAHHLSCCRVTGVPPPPPPLVCTVYPVYTAFQVCQTPVYTVRLVYIVYPTLTVQARLTNMLIKFQ
jgi:hypothetical protein